MTVVIDVGHCESDQGAVSPFEPFTTEWNYNFRLSQLIQQRVEKAHIIISSRDAGQDGYKDLPRKINAFHPDFILSLHCNAATPSARGTEMIHHRGSEKGIKFATILQQNISSVFGWSEGQKEFRGIKTPIDGRGSDLLQKTVAPCVIAEPFFLTNDEDHRMGLDLIDDLAAAYARSIDEFCETFPSR